MRVRALTEGALLAALAVIINVVTRSTPVPGLPMLLIFIHPLPVTLAYVRHGARLGLVTALAAGLLLALVVGPVNAGPSALFVTVAGLTLGYVEHRRLGYVQGVLLTALAITALLLLNMAWWFFVLGQDVAFAPIAQSYDEVMRWMPELAQRLGIPPRMEHLAYATLAWLRPYLVLLGVASIVGVAVAAALVMVVISRWAVRSLNRVA